MVALSEGIQKATKDGATLKNKFVDPEQFKGLSKEEAMKKAQEEAVKKSMEMMMPLQSLAMFYMTLVQGDKEPAYYGKFISPGDAQSVLLRWKKDDTTYRVIMGDLSATDMSPEELQQIESQMPSQEQSPPESSSSIAPLEDTARYAQFEAHGQSMINIKKILLACFAYVGKNNGQWPETLESIAGQDGVKTEGHIYILPNKAISPQKNVVIYESYQTWGDGINVGFADGHVEFIRDQAEFQKLLSQ